MISNIYPWQEELKSRLLGNSLPHALLLKGRSGIGKLDFASHLARSLFCESSGKDGDACNVCTACSWFDQGVHPDFRKIEPESDESGKRAVQITVDQVRSLSSFMNMTTHRNGYRIVLIHPADAMNAHAANALLKTLEEPQGKTLFLLVTHKPRQLLPTILSRCRMIAMPSPSPGEAEAWLRGKGVENPAPYLAESGNAPLVALAEASKDRSLLERFLGELASPASLEPVAFSETYQKTELPELLRWFQKWCHDLASCAFSGRIRYFPALSVKIREVSDGADRVELAKFQRKLCQAQSISSHPVNARLFIEELVLTYRSATSGK